jgi:hypothetical protein
MGTEAGIGGARAGAQRAPRPTVIVCAWCESTGSPHGAAREPGSAQWWAVSHEAVRDAVRAGHASHGICPLCRPLVLEEWGLK